MAFIVQVGAKFATGDTVKAYPESNWPAIQRPPAAGSTQVGSSTESATVASDGTVTFSTLTEDTTYYLTKDGSGVYMRARPDAVSNRQDPGGGAVSPSAVSALNLRKTVTTAGTAVPLSATPLRVKKATVCALATNTGIVVVGGSGVIAAAGTRNSTPLNPFDSRDLGAVDLSAVYIDSTVSTDGVTVDYEA